MPPSIAPAIMDHQPDEEDGGAFKSSSRGMFERRKRRKPKPPATTKPQLAGVPKGVDPYESDPGESYREHCVKHDNRSLNCLTLPQFLIKNQTKQQPPPNRHHHLYDGRTETSPFHDGSPPTSLPRSATRVRYSLRSTITDGTDPQPMGPSVLERRKLRPNDVKLNISHWSDEGGRPYMEDR